MTVGQSIDLADSRIDSGEIDVWRIDLDQTTPDAWHDALAAEDFVRAGRFAKPVHRERFLQSRFCLRTLLSAYTGVAARNLEFEFNAEGKPLLAQRYRLRFNLSHSENLAAIAVGRQDAIGIDIERLTPPADIRQLARQVFTENECRVLDGLPDHALALPFLTGWTRKEAVLKALGVGLTLDPRRITVGLCAGRRRIHHRLHAGTIEVKTIADDDHAVLSLAICCDSDRVPGDARIRDFHALENREMAL